MLPLVLIFFSSCSRLSLAVRWADTFIVEAVDSRFDLSSEQKSEFQFEVKQSLQQIKSEKFPIWAQQFESWADRIEKEKMTEAISFEMWDWSFSQFRELSKYANSPMQKLINQSAEKNFEKNQKQALEEIAVQKQKLNSEEKRFEDQKKKYMTWIDFWHGSIEQEQKKKLEASIKENPFPWEASLTHRETQVRRFFELRNDKLALRDWVKKSLDNPESVRSKEYKEVLGEWQKKLRISIRDFQLSLSEKQIQDFVKELRKRALELRELSAKKD